MDRTIRVTGTGRLTLQPDTIQLLLILKGTHDVYSDALAHSSDATGRLKAALAGIAIEPKDLKTTRFAIDSRYEGYQDSDGHYKQRFIGFEYDHRLKLEMAEDRERLGKVLTAFLQSGVSVEFQILYTIKNREEVKEELLKQAIQDARIKAEWLADAAGVRLGKVIRIGYPQEATPLRNEVMNSARVTGQAVHAAINPDIEPDGIHLTESVRVTWGIQS